MAPSVVGGLLLLLGLFGAGSIGQRQHATAANWWRSMPGTMPAVPAVVV
ncbi:hypothetical protein ONA91_26130 [Micromonospora sp. DR5-3]|nr:MULTISPECIES: hypothetical protein [unclassified Micromonospora]MCW3817932.1 hypothetical protein [Micromonospora sp. DR5-3]